MASQRLGLIRGRVGLTGLAIAAVVLLAPAAAAAPVPFEVGKPVLNVKKGRAKLPVEVPERGKVSVSTAKRLAYTEIFFDGAGRGMLPIRARQGKPVKLLKARGKLRAKFTVTFAPQGPGSSGGPSSEVLTITLRLKR